MALTGDQQKSGSYLQLGNRHDFCYMEAMELTAKNEAEYTKMFRALKGKYEGKPMMKLRKGSSEICISLEKLHEFVKNNPLTEKE